MKNKSYYLNELKREIKSQPCSITKIKKMILEMESNNIDINSKTYNGRTLLHYAVINNQKRLVRLFIKLGINPEICDDNYNTPLHLAVVKNKYQIIQELIKSGVNVNVTGEFEQTPLHLAVSCNNLEIVKLLVKNGADCNLVDEQNLKPIDYAIDEKNEKIISYITSYNKGGKTNEQNIDI